MFDENEARKKMIRLIMTVRRAMKMEKMVKKGGTARSLFLS